MEIPSYYRTSKYPFYELIGAGVVLIIALTTLLSRYLYFNIIFDTAYLTGALALVVAEWNKKTPGKLPAVLRSPLHLLFICLYLFIDAVLVSLMLFSNAGFLFLLYVSLGILYGMSLLLRLQEHNIRLTTWSWKSLLTYPAVLTTTGLLLCFFALYLPMVYYYMPFYSYTGPQYGYNAISGYGMTHPGVLLHGGSSYTFKGYQGFLGHLACLVTAFMFLFHALHVMRIREYKHTALFLKAGVIGMGIWWILAAKGYRSVWQTGNVLFLVGVGLLVIALFFPQALSQKEKK
jgi:hypothetical protein